MVVSTYYKTKDGEDFNNEQEGQNHANGLGYMDKGLEASQRRDHDEAISYFDKAIPLLSGRDAGTYGRSKGLAYLYRGDCYFHKKNYDHAIEDCNVALSYRSGISYSGEANAYNIRGDAYKGKGEYEKAKADYKKAADLGDKSALKNLANLEGYILVDQGLAAAGEGNYAKALKLYQKAADMGSRAGITNIGLLYAQGQGVPKDMNKAVELFHKAADMGYTDAMLNLGNLYYQGLGVPKDTVKAREWWKKAAPQGQCGSMNGLGIFYRDGLAGLKQDFAKAEELFKKSIANGSEKAKEHLAKLKQMRGK